MQIRIMTTEDYERVYALWISMPGVGLNDADDAKNGIARFLMRNPTSCFVAEEGGEMAGSILAGHDGRRGHIYHLAVHPSYRRQGIGRKLVQAALGALSEEGITKAMLVVFKTNSGGNEFWEKQGFTARNDLVYRNKSLKSEST
jgi:ribosomal protein S18 acetylase RimI-like enzyme